ncbi:MAG TPA: heme peroxidase family protein [Roseovarius sp.]
MTIFLQSHGGSNRISKPKSRATVAPNALVPATGDVAVDEAADFGYLFPPSGDPGDYLSDDVLGELDELGDLMVPEEDPGNLHVTPDSTLPPVLTYWGQFLDHELTARTDRETEISKIDTAVPLISAAEIETKLKNARTPRFDLDSVYGGLPVGVDITPDVVKVISGIRHPSHPEKMRVGTAEAIGPLPDGLDPHRDLPRFQQVQPDVRDAYLNILRDRLPAADFAAFEAGLPQRAIIGDMRNDENLIIAQFHLSFLRFHNRTVDYLAANDTGWMPDFHAAQALTRLHYQWLIVDGYLRKICDPAVVDAVLANKARHFFEFRAAHADRIGARTLGNAMALEFSVAAFRFGHTMVRDAYDYNKNFGRSDGSAFLPSAPFDEIFTFTGGGGFSGGARVPENWIIDWTRFVTADGDTSDGHPAKVARKIDTLLAPPMGDLHNEAKDEADPQIKALFRHLARRNLRRGLSLRLPTGQALHAHLKSVGALTSNPVANVADLLDGKPELKAFLEDSQSRMFERTPLWFYCLAEAEAAGGDHLGELGSWIVASTFIATLLSDPDSALSMDFTPQDSPLKAPDGTPIDTIAKWMQFALVME